MKPTQKEIFMKLFAMLLTLIVVLFALTCNGQPGTKSTIKVGIVSTQADKSFLVFADVQTDSVTGSVLTQGMDYLNPDVSYKLKTLQDVIQSGDTTWGYITYDDQVFQQFVLGGLVQVNDLNLKYSAMTVSSWLALDSIEAMNAGFIWELD